MRRDEGAGGAGVGRWSHKAGEAPVTDWDADGNLITDPEVGRGWVVVRLVVVRFCCGAVGCGVVGASALYSIAQTHTAI